METYLILSQTSYQTCNDIQNSKKSGHLYPKQLSAHSFAVKLIERLNEVALINAYVKRGVRQTTQW